MSEQDFELYLTLLAKTLRLSDKQRDAIASELRDHLEARLDELTAEGLDKHDAIQAALAEFGDASALANDFTSIGKQRNRRRIMQTTFGTLAAAAAIGFAAMTLTPTNYRGHPTQPMAGAQDTVPGAAEDPFAPEGGAGIGTGEARGTGAATTGARDAAAPGALGGAGGGRAADVGFGRRGGLAAAGEATFVPAQAPELSIHVVDCTAILSPREDGLDLLARTEALANAVEETVGAIRPHGPSEIQVRAFEEFLIITATDDAYTQAEALLENISSHVQRRDAIQQERDVMEQREALSRIRQEIERNAVELAELQAAAAEIQAQRSVLAENGQGAEHPDVRQLGLELEGIQAIIETLRANRRALEQQHNRIRNLSGD